MELISRNLDFVCKLGRGICGSFSLSLLFSRSQVVNFLEWKHHYLTKNIIIFHSNDNLFTQSLFLNKKMCHLVTFSWRLESERTRARGKRNHKFRALFWGIFSFFLSTQIKNKSNLKFEIWFTNFQVLPRFGSFFRNFLQNCLQKSFQFTFL